MILLKYRRQQPAFLVFGIIVSPVSASPNAIGYRDLARAIG